MAIGLGWPYFADRERRYRENTRSVGASERQFINKVIALC